MTADDHLRAASAVAFAKLRPLEYLYSFLRRGIRPGGRAVDTSRLFFISHPNKDRSCSGRSSSSSSRKRHGDDDDEEEQGEEEAGILHASVPSSSSSSSSVIGTADSSATVRLGDTGTAVVCRLYLEVATPASSMPGSGFLDVTCRLPPISSPRFSLSGTPAEQSLATAELLRSVCIDMWDKIR